MLLEALRLRDFRNLQHVMLTPNPRFNVIAGPNGQGKTNLLEAIYLLSAVKSFRPGTTNRALIHFERTEASLEARVERGGHERLVRLEISERGKKVFLNEGQVRNISDFFGTLNVVIFGPDDIGILRGSPSERRRFMDRAIFNAHPAFSTESTHYEDVLKHRNALLKEPRVDPALLGVYDEQLITYGAQVLRRRLDFITHFRPVLTRTFATIFDPTLAADLRYAPSWLDEGDDAFDEAAALQAPQYLERSLEQALRRTEREERERGYTLIGPHRDDLHTTLGGHDVRTFGSQGQTRAFVLAMKIAEITYLEERYHFAPILLLDDVSSELDRQRNRLLFDFLRSRTQGQVFITTTHRDFILLDQNLSIFDVQGGQVVERVSDDA
ncbi:DNA replication/repair protein RecF [Bradymonadaceae bacterium TMQ3]|nr:DNA replication/repair protein RecF [Bradymonadaceae bacterium TMQ3]TXC75001.1 DNA replication/repair protein RecF [Bradymonadales bacterium TMQ1]